MLFLLSFQGLRYTLSRSDDSGVSESESDSEIQELVSKGQVTRVIKKGDGIHPSYVTLSSEGNHPPHPSVTDHLTEPSTSSGDSGIQSLSSTKPFSLFSSSEEKPRAATLSREFRSQFKASGIQQFSPQSCGEQQHQQQKQQLSPSTAGDLSRGLPLTFLKPTSPSVANQSGALYSKGDSLNIGSMHFTNHMAEATRQLPVDVNIPLASSKEMVDEEWNSHKYLEFGKPVTLLEREHDEILLLSRTLPRTGADRSRRNSVLAFSNDKMYDLSPTHFSSSSTDLHSIGVPGSVMKDFRFSATTRDVKDDAFSDDQRLAANVRASDGLPSPSMSSFNHKDMKIVMKDAGEPGYKFPFNFNLSERESSV